MELKLGKVVVHARVAMGRTIPVGGYEEEGADTGGGKHQNICLGDDDNSSWEQGLELRVESGGVGG